MKRIDYKNCGKLADSCFNIVKLLSNTTNTLYAFKMQCWTCHILQRVAYEEMIQWLGSFSILTIYCKKLK